MERRASPAAIAVLALIFALVALLVYGVTTKGAGNKFDNAVRDGKRLAAPVRTGKVVGRPATTSIADYRGKVIVFNIWASWCTACRSETKVLEKAYRAYGKRGLVVLGADMEDLPSEAIKFARAHEMTYPLFQYTKSDAGRDYGTKQVPETFVLDRRGRVAALTRGPITATWLNSQIERLIDEPS